MTSTRRTARRLAIVCLVAAATLSTPMVAPALATPPGSNGRISFMRPDDNFHWQVWTANPDLTHQHQVTSGGFDNGWATWSPDGTRLAFESTRIAPEANGDLKEIYVMRPDGTQITQVTHIGGYSDEPSWAPDASLLAFASDGADYPHSAGIYLVRPDGTGMRRILALPTDDPRARWLEAPRISPDGRHVAYTYYRGGKDTPHKYAGEVSALYVADIDGGHPRRLTPWGTTTGDADWSPDGTQLTFETNGTHLGNFASVMVIGADGSGSHALTTDLFTGIGYFNGNGKQQPLFISSSYDPVWSPDGTTILFSHGSYDSTGGATGLQVIHPDGSGQEWVSDVRLEEHQVDWGTAPLE
jgi:Tol biopolymer transport system component